MNNITQEQAVKILKEFSKQVKDIGWERLAYNITFNSNYHLDIKRGQSLEFLEFCNSINEISKEKGDDYLILNLCGLKEYNKICKKEIDKTFLIQKILNQTSVVFDYSKEKMNDNNIRDGIRVYACGSAIKIMFDILNMNLEEIALVFKNNKIINSIHKSKVKKLDYTHPYQKKILDKYLELKENIIKTIIDEQ
jgi:hypothetical protein